MENFEVTSGNEISTSNEFNCLDNESINNQVNNLIDKLNKNIQEKENEENEYKDKKTHSLIFLKTDIFMTCVLILLTAFIDNAIYCYIASNAEHVININSVIVFNGIISFTLMGFAHCISSDISNYKSERVLHEMMVNKFIEDDANIKLEISKIVNREKDICLTDKSLSKKERLENLKNELVFLQENGEIGEEKSLKLGEKAKNM